MQPEQAIIFDCSIERVGGNADLFSFECLVGDHPRRMEFHLDHSDIRIQERGQKALHMLADACGIDDINDTSDFLNKEFDPAVLSEIDAIIDPPKTHGRRTPKGFTPAPVKNGGKYVYVVSCIDSATPICKIGIAASPETRVQQLSTNSPHVLRLEMARYFDNARDVEAMAHAHFSRWRQNGEWFAITAAEAIRYIGTTSGESSWLN